MWRGSPAGLQAEEPARQNDFPPLPRSGRGPGEGVGAPRCRHWIKQVLGFRQFSMRGLEKTRAV